MNYLWILLLLPMMGQAYAQQTIIVNQTTPCFLNYTAGTHLWENCCADEDFLSFALLPWEWVTGGYFSMLVVAMIVLMVYIKYQKAIYAIVIGIIFLPISFQFFPAVFLTWALVMSAVAGGILIFYIIKKQTD